MRIAPDAWILVLPATLAALASAFFHHWIVAVALAFVAVLLLLFFRIPRRTAAAGADGVLAAADGRILSVDAEPRENSESESLVRIATFLSVFDVHVQFVPASGVVLSVKEAPGRGRAAFRAGIESSNQRVSTQIRLADGREMRVRQIAGLVARRARGWLSAGDQVQAGDLLGIIRFGSRVDLLLPPGSTPCVSRGDRVRGGETIVARLGSAQE